MIPSPISIVIPLHNEEACVSQLCDTIVDFCTQAGYQYQLILVDDGSRDATLAQLRHAAARHPHIQVIVLQRNFGQTAAMAAGIDHAIHDIIITMDGDLQNHPSDIPSLLQPIITHGYDVVSGWRKNRQDHMLSRKIPSWLANRLIGRVTGVRLHDYGCSLKAYRAPILKQVRLYGDLHRFIPALCAVYGARVTEIPVQHYARTTGQSKYGISRTFRVILDLLTVKFLLSYGTRPLHFFGAAAALFFLTGLLAFIAVLTMKFSPHPISINRNPIFYLGVLMGIGGVQMLSVGLLAELIMRTYYESQNKPIYLAREIFDSNSPAATDATTTVAPNNTANPTVPTPAHSPHQ